ncbi:hypothetical protein DPM19_29775 [Actinomadura craniellae]|uniref:Uncharacterized protein n=1 Tax=Actinomadura craniellae TaxID=2231787 RepID=A0A365GXF3_9ACTN|nr:hypothetical protein [Actinomadura craniellae]RAY11496.1 hypothetical protein DPM19_29775 [Actinomadura craniellae]
MTTPYYAGGPPRLFAWDALLGGGRGAGGITGDEKQARERLAEVLRGEPAGTRGVVRRAYHTGSGHEPYEYGEPVAIGTATDRGVTWT